MNTYEHISPKKLAAERAVSYIEDGMTVGLGTGSTAKWAIEAIAVKVSEGMNLRAAASSKQSEELAKQLGISIVPFSDITSIDVTIDGADEVDKSNNLIKGGGGALLREKILAYHSKQFIVIVDDSKLVDTLGAFPLPVEILPFASELTLRKLSELGGQPVIRQINSDTVYTTDNGNLIADCSFGTIAGPSWLDEQLSAIPGVVENGLFLSGMVSRVVIGSSHDGTTYTRGTV
ncbi:ribose-5-phosphate isomerase RpiA [Paenibacillus sp. GCM10023252]|uniref:ribose-5-phosphate isomerase RpiA n=1 Tax=Paenibacillus sp. GCM10023252 TaxID=3252649 RepID=UPI0036215876